MASSSSSIKRKDGRSATDMRPVEIQIGSLPNADGSGAFSFGTEAAIASFAGPLEPPGARMEVFTEAVLTVTHRPLEGSAATPSKALAAGLHTIYHSLLDLRSHPRTRTTLTVQSLNSSQSASQPLYVSSRAVSINAATLSILNAGSIGIKGVPVAIGVATVSKNGKGKQRSYYDDVPEDKQMEEDSEEDKEVTLVLDPTRSEEQNAKARFCFGWAFGAGLSSDTPASDRMDQGDGGSRETEHDTEAECVYVESDGVFDAVTVSQSPSSVSSPTPAKSRFC
ncbi:hypothetical protein QFC22_001954 [Naganishia vaughanmartiniae]|uniref:Uncharacterized protein n=1 Tax=Naganishia vaughanmartiniae TaxID=1424756 RepID=A0ACC2XG04_9TREE|nr:hypothetical protein QFC22_001954 [Naganishia vaughanmartiniae]